MRTTLKEIARQLELSHTTVARILNKDPAFRATAETKQRVLALARELGYRPSITARNLVKRRTSHLGLLLDTIRDPFFTRVAESLAYEATQAGYELALGLGRVAQE